MFTTRAGLKTSILVAVFLAGVLTGILARPLVARLFRPYYYWLRGIAVMRIPDPPARTIPVTRIMPSPIPRFEAGAVVFENKLYLLGGFFSTDLKITGRCDVYDPASDTWSRLADMAFPVTHAGVAEVDGEIWVAGGFAGNHPGPPSAKVYRYNIGANTWTQGPSLPEARGSGALVRLGNQLHYFGGVGSDRDTDSGVHWVLDLDNPARWTVRASLPDPRNHLTAATLGGRIHAIGGQQRHDTAPLDLTAHHAYDPASNTWRALAPLARPRSHCEPGTIVHNGRIIVTGGRSIGVSAGFRFEVVALYDADAYDPAADRWTSLPSLPVAMRASVARIIGDRVFAGAGGIEPDGIHPAAEMFSFPVSALGLDQPASK